MQDLTVVEKRFFEDLFGMETGYVLSFSNRAFADFFDECLGIDIFDEKFAIYGESKAKRLRAFWALEDSESVARVLNELLRLWLYHNDFVETPQYTHCKRIADRLSGNDQAKSLHAESQALSAGAKPKYPWELVKRQTFKLLEYHQDFIPEDTKWNGLAKLVEEINSWILEQGPNVWPRDENDPEMPMLPGNSTLRGRLKEFYSEWKRLSQSKADEI